MRYCLPFEYNPHATAELWSKTLNTCIPEEDKQRVLAEYFGYCFMRNTSKHRLKLEKMLFLVGSGGNGKGVVFEVMKALFGDENTSDKPLHTLTKSDKSEYYLAELDGRLLNYDSEFKYNTLDAGLFKKLASGEPITARRPAGRPFTITDYPKFVINTNGLPRDVEQVKGYFRRFMIIPFEVEIPDDEQDAELDTKIKSVELSGVLNWCLAGLQRLIQQKKFSKCESAEQTLKHFIRESDSVQMFVSEYQYTKLEGLKTHLKTLYSQYGEYCRDAGNKTLGKINFAKRLERIGYVRTERGDEFFMYRQSMEDAF
jgi:putative DNA primase/helicase